MFEDSCSADKIILARGLSCRLNKDLQTLMSEDSRWNAAVTKDVGAILAHLEGVLSTLSLPQMPALQSSAQDPAGFFDHDEQNNDQDDDDDPSNDNCTQGVAL